MATCVRRHLTCLSIYTQHHRQRATNMTRKVNCNGFSEIDLAKIAGKESSAAAIAEEERWKEAELEKNQQVEAVIYSHFKRDPEKDELFKDGHEFPIALFAKHGPQPIDSFACVRCMASKNDKSSKAKLPTKRGKADKLTELLKKKEQNPSPLPRADDDTLLFRAYLCFRNPVILSKPVESNSEAEGEQDLDQESTTGASINPTTVNKESPFVIVNNKSFLLEASECLVDVTY